MRKGLMATLLIGGLAINASAQITLGEKEEKRPAPDLTMGSTPQSEASDAKEPDWFMGMDYAGFEFEIPAGSVVERGQTMVVKYPDGTFGLSMSNTAKKGSSQREAMELCRRLATSMHLPNPSVERVNFGKCSGAKASGMLEGQHVTMLVLPYNDNEVTTVILATPSRTGWVEHFLETLKR